MFSVIAIASLRNVSIIACYGMVSMLFYALAALLFFIPCSLVCARFSSLLPSGGIYSWTKSAFGPKVACMAVWLQWMQTLLWYPSILTFIAVTLGRSLAPSLLNTPWYMVLMILLPFWGCTWMNLKGIQYTAMVNRISVILGLILPTLFLSWMALDSILQGLQDHPQGCSESISHSPSLSLWDWNTWTALLGVMVSFAGMELSEVHDRDVENPKKTFPRSIFISACIILVIYVTATYALISVLPSVGIVSGIVDAFELSLCQVGHEWAFPLTGILLSIGALGGLATWIIGPSKGLLLATQDAHQDGDQPSKQKGLFPVAFATTNQQGVPSYLLFLQGGIVSVISLLFFLIPSVEGAFWILNVLLGQFYLILYMLMFAAALRLRIGTQISATIGICSTFFSFAFAFIPPPISFVPPPHFFFEQGFAYSLSIALGSFLGCIAPWTFPRISRWGQHWNSPSTQKKTPPQQKKKIGCNS